MASSLSYVAIALAIVVVLVVLKTATVVPQQSAYVVEYLGKYSRTLQAGFHILTPFFERVAYKHSLKEIAVDIAEQVCITRDNVQVGVDAVLYMQVMDPHLASYGITNYGFAISQLAQTTLRSEIGKIELDRTFEARGIINTNVVSELDKASAPGASRCCATRSRTSRRRATCCRPWRSRCVPNGRSVRSCSPRRANGTPRSIPPRATSSA